MAELSRSVTRARLLAFPGADPGQINDLLDVYDYINGNEWFMDERIDDKILELPLNEFVAFMQKTEDDTIKQLVDHFWNELCGDDFFGHAHTRKMSAGNYMTRYWLLNDPVCHLMPLRVYERVVDQLNADILEGWRDDENEPDEKLVKLLTKPQKGFW